MLLARADGISQRFYSMYAQIRQERKEYYEILEKTQKGNLNITKCSPDTALRDIQDLIKKQKKEEEVQITN